MLRPAIECMPTRIAFWIKTEFYLSIDPEYPSQCCLLVYSNCKMGAFVVLQPLVWGSALSYLCLPLPTFTLNSVFKSYHLLIQGQYWFVLLLKEFQFVVCTQMENQPELNFRNTRSKFYKKKPNNESPEKLPRKNSSNQEKTSGYWKEKGNAEFKNCNFQKAIANYSKAIELNPIESVYYSNRARCYYSLGQIDKALKDAQQSIEMDDKNIKGHYICGCCLAELSKKDNKKIDTAIKELKKALTLCKGQSKESFEQQVHLAIFRAKKLKWYINYEKQYKQSNRIVEVLKKTSPEDAQKLKEILNSKKPKFEIPDNLCCKITLQLMEDPVVSAAGVSYQRQALLDHFSHNSPKDPFTNQSISAQIYPNKALKNTILQFLEQNPWAFEHQKGQSSSSIKL